VTNPRQEFIASAAQIERGHSRVYRWRFDGMELRVDIPLRIDARR
jgi:ribosomal protein L15E